mmetsp:Transcript_12001/g.36998  ORF Transcript_12001/g.36998 Transcript_12001/m.36998 type:complete len:246 (+) Transcript_12001:647-1384(+)
MAAARMSSRCRRSYAAARCRTAASLPASAFAASFPGHASNTPSHSGRSDERTGRRAFRSDAVLSPSVAPAPGGAPYQLAPMQVYANVRAPNSRATSAASGIRSSAGGSRAGTRSSQPEQTCCLPDAIMPRLKYSHLAWGEGAEEGPHKVSRGDGAPAHASARESRRLRDPLLLASVRSKRRCRTRELRRHALHPLRRPHRPQTAAWRTSKARNLIPPSCALSLPLTPCRGSSPSARHGACHTGAL